MKHKTIYQKLSFAVLAAVFSMLLYSSCLPDLPDYVEDYDLVYTKYDDSYNFGSIQIYHMPDRVAHLVPPGENPSTTYDNQILNALERNLNGLGWTRAAGADTANADIVVIATAFAQDNEVCYYWWDYWGYWWGYYPPYGGYYPGYPGYASCSEFTTGSVVVQMVDRTIDTTAADLPLRWVGAMNGLLEGSSSNVASRINTSIDQMFTQSPYLKN